MKRIYPLVSLLMLLILVFVTPVLASTEGALYHATISINNANTSAINNGITSFYLKTQGLVDNGFISENGTNSAIKTSTGGDIAYMPASTNGTDWWVFVPTIGAQSQQNYSLYTGGPPMDSKIRYFPGLEGMTTADNETLELGNNFIIEQKGWVDTTAVGANLVNKPGAFRTYISGSGNITSTISEGWVSPTGHTADGWVNATKAYDDDEGSSTDGYSVPTGNNYSDYLTLSIAPMNITSVRYLIDETFYHGTAYNALEIDVYYNSDWHNILSTYTETENEWATVDCDASGVTGMRLRFHNTDPLSALTAYVYEVDFRSCEVSVTATGIDPDEHTVKTTANRTNLTISIDGATSGAWYNSAPLNGASVPDNDNPWYFIQNYSMPYMESLKIWTD